MIIKTLNLIAYWLQKHYMRGKITREIVELERAIFHPVDWSLKVTKKLLEYKSTKKSWPEN